MLQVFYFVFGCLKRAFCVRKLPLVLFHSGPKIPLLPTQNLGKCLLLPPHFPGCTQTQTHMPGPKHAMRASKHGGLLGSFFALFQYFSNTCPSGIPPPNHHKMHNKIVRM